MAKKSNERWVEVVGGKIRDRLIAHQERRFEFHPDGPYTQYESMPINVSFNENAKGETGCRFGYQWGSFLTEFESIETRAMYAGFTLFEADVAIKRFLPNLRANLDGVAGQLGAWLQKQESPYFTFAQKGGKKFKWSSSIGARHLPSQLALYGDLERPSTGVTDRPGIRSGTTFNLTTGLENFGPMSNGEMLAKADVIAKETVSIFNELSFLYELLLSTGEKLKNPQITSPPTVPKENVPSAKLEDEENISTTVTFEADPEQDDRTFVFATVAQRQGQSVFRDELLKAYKNQCAITGYGVVDVLQAAHIVPYNGEKSNHITNGLLLRADIHNLFDRGLLSIDPRTNKIEVSPSLLASEYAKFHGLRLSLPRDNSKRPDAKALEHHYSKRRKK